MGAEDEFRVNLQELFEDYAWRRFSARRNIVSRIFRRRSKYYIDIRWGFIEFKHETTRFEERPDAVDHTPAQVSVSGESGAREKPKVKRDVVLYKSDYENKTPLNQEYTFSSTRETTNSTTIEFQESFTKGGECNIEISVPGDLVTVGAGLSGELSVTKTESETFQTTATWTVDTKVGVKRGHRAEAQVHVSERNSVADFEVKTTMKIKAGKDLPIAIRRLSDDKVVHVVVVPNLLDVFHDLIRVQKNPNLDYSEYIDKDKKTPCIRNNIILYTRGTCKSISWKNQHVEVHSEKIASYSCSDDDSLKEEN